MTEPDFRPPPPRTRRTDRLTAPYRGPDRRKARPADEETPAQLMARIKREENARLLMGFGLIVIGVGIGWLLRKVVAGC